MRTTIYKKILCLVLALTYTVFSQQRPLVLFNGLYSAEKGAQVATYNEACYRKISTERRFNFVTPETLESYKRKTLGKTGSAQALTQLEEARKLLTRGKTKFGAADPTTIRSAAADLEEARRIFLQQLPHLKSNRDLLDSHLYLGAVLVALKKNEAAQKAFEQVVYLNPDYEISASEFSPEAVAVYAAAKQTVTGIESSRLSIESTPPGATIYMNGKLMGTTPKKLNLKRGEYFFMLEKKGMEPWFKPVPIERSVEFITADLKASAQSANWAEAFSVREEGSDADDSLLLSVANGTKADLVFLTSVEERGAPRLLTQWFDVKSGNFSKVTLADLSGSLDTLPESCLESIQTLALQLDERGKLKNTPDLEYSENDLKIAGKQEQARPETQSEKSGAWYTQWWIYPLIIGVGVGAYFGIQQLGTTKGATIHIDNKGNL